MNTIQNSHGAKNAWQSIDASSNNGDIVAQSNNQGLMIQPCSNQASNLISGVPPIMDINRPSVTQGGAMSSAQGQRSPRNNIKNQFYGVHGRGMSIQGT